MQGNFIFDNIRGVKAERIELATGNFILLLKFDDSDVTIELQLTQETAHDLYMKLLNYEPGMPGFYGMGNK